MITYSIRKKPCNCVMGVFNGKWVLCGVPTRRRMVFWCGKFHTPSLLPFHQKLHVNKEN